MFFERRIGGLQSRWRFCIVVTCRGTVVVDVIIIVVIAVGRQSGFCISSVRERHLSRERERGNDIFIYRYKDCFFLFKAAPVA